MRVFDERSPQWRPDDSTRRFAGERTMTSLLASVGAAVGEIAGCFSFWAWFRLGKSAWWLVPGLASLSVFACLLTLGDAAAASRAYAYGGVYITAPLLWLWMPEDARPDRWDIVGAAVCLIGATIILFGPRPVVS
jgi:small multidrug resistance family-3 protein